MNLLKAFVLIASCYAHVEFEINGDLEAWSVNASAEMWKLFIKALRMETKKDAESLAEILLRAPVNLSKLKMEENFWMPEQSKVFLEHVQAVNSPHERAKLEDFFLNFPKSNELSDLLFGLNFDVLAARLAKTDEQLGKVLSSMPISRVSKDLLCFYNDLFRDSPDRGAELAKKAGFIKCYDEGLVSHEGYMAGLLKELEEADLERITYILARGLPKDASPWKKPIIDILQQKICVKEESESNEAELRVILSVVKGLCGEKIVPPHSELVDSFGNFLTNPKIDENVKINVILTADLDNEKGMLGPILKHTELDLGKISQGILQDFIRKMGDLMGDGEINMEDIKRWHIDTCEIMKYAPGVLGGLPGSILADMLSGVSQDVRVSIYRQNYVYPPDGNFDHFFFSVYDLHYGAPITIEEYSENVSRELEETKSFEIMDNQDGLKIYRPRVWAKAIPINKLFYFMLSSIIMYKKSIVLLQADFCDQLFPVEERKGCPDFVELDMRMLDEDASLRSIADGWIINATADERFSRFSGSIWFSIPYRIFPLQAAKSSRDICRFFSRPFGEE